MRLPLFIEFRGKRVLVIGGGGVGTSRAKKFLEAGAEVRVLSLDFSEELRKLGRDGKVKLIKGDAFDKNLIELLIADSHLVVVAIPSLKVNDLVCEIARSHKTMVNLANDAERTEVVVPFEDEVEGIRFAVTTEGKSGIVARKVKEAFKRMLEEDEETIYFLKAMDHLKKYMKSHSIPVQMRMKLYFVISADEEFRRLVKEGKVEEAQNLAERLVEEYVSGKRKIDENLVRIQF